MEYRSIIEYEAPQALVNWGTTEKLGNFWKHTGGFLTERQAHSREALSRIRCSVKLICGEEDVTYPITYYEQFLANLQEAGVDATLDVVPDAPYLMSMTHDDEYVSLFSHKRYPPGNTVELG